MGRGSRLELKYATPWQKAAGTLTSTNQADWTASLIRVYPKKI
jgi:hypothetical protein